MSVYIDTNSRLHHDQEHTLAVTCPHCQVLAHITPIAIPQYDQLVAVRPKHAGLVFRCDSCNAPVFLRFAIKMYAANRVELTSTFTELEHAREKFTFTHLPEGTEVLFKESLECYSAGCYNAFASMCRRTVQALFTDLGDGGKLKLFDELNEIRDLAELDAATFAVIKSVIFGQDQDPRGAVPLLDPYQAGVLLEVIKDLLHQAYVRKGRLQQAMMVRRYFLAEDDPTVTSIETFRA
jgi:hypothetical protein